MSAPGSYYEVFLVNQLEDRHEFTLHRTLRPDILDLTENEIRILRPVQFDLMIRGKPSRIWVQGTIDVTLELHCDRCAEPFEKSDFLTFKYIFLPISFVPLHSHRIVEEEDFITSYFEHDEIKLHEILYEQILISLPLKKLCQEDCKGLCSVCGANLNKEPCTCEESEMDPRWMPLAQLLKKLS